MEPSNKNTKYVDVCNNYKSKLEECESKKIQDYSCELVKKLMANCLEFQKGKNNVRTKL
jgi:hypothetical protein